MYIGRFWAKTLEFAESFSQLRANVPTSHNRQVSWNRMNSFEKRQATTCRLSKEFMQT
jgi:hypothetical protein